MIIYCITNKVNGKQYVGLTMRTLEERFKEHCKAESAIGRALRKYGLDNFKLEIIDSSETSEDLWKKESYWIKNKDTFRNGYNMTDGGWKKKEYSKTLNTSLNDKQIKFIEWVDEENKKEVNINNTKEMIRSIIINTMRNFLLSDGTETKRKNAEMIARLKPIYFEEVMRTKVINTKQLNEWIA